MSRVIDLIDQRFTRLEVIRLHGTDKRGERMWECICDCGNMCNVLSSNLRSGHTKSCGCLNRERSRDRKYKHGMYGTGVYSSWQAMIQRCANPNNPFYHRYGGRGIKICDRWLSFENFYADMGDSTSGYQIDRIDNDGDYEPTNCRWSTPKENTRNRSSNIEVTYKGKTQCIAAWEEELGFKHGTLWCRLYHYNWSIDKAMTQPVMKTSREPVTFNGKTQSITKHAKDHGLGLTTVLNRLRIGWSLEDALTRPVK